MERQEVRREDREEDAGRVMHLVQSAVHPGLLAAAQDIMEGVASGDIIGLGVVVQLRGGKFFVDALGRMVREPHNARGWVASLDDHLRRIADERNSFHTTT